MKDMDGMDRMKRRESAREYKERKVVAGIYAMRCRPTNHEASARPVTLPSRSSATRSIDNYLEPSSTGGTRCRGALNKTG